MIGPPMAGKTSLRRTLSSSRSCLTRREDRTISIEVSDEFCVGKHTFIVYDFGGHTSYVPLQYIAITPHSLFCLTVDLASFCENIKNEDYLDVNVCQIYYRVYHRVRCPVIQVIGTKSDLIPSNVEKECCDKIIKALWKIEKKEINLLRIREKELNDVHCATNDELKNCNMKYVKLSSSDIKDKINSVQELLKPENRPQLPTEVIVVNCVSMQGIGNCRDRLVQTIDKQRDLFPATNVPISWTKLSSWLSYFDIASREDVKALCKKFSIEDEDEINAVLQHLRIAGKIIFFENHPKLKDVVFLNPAKMLKALGNIFNHENFLELMSFKGNMKLTLHEKELLRKGIMNRTIIDKLLTEFGSLPKHYLDDLVELMIKLDLCFRLVREDVSQGDEEYVIPYLALNDSYETTQMWPKFSNGNQISLAFDLVTAEEPKGLFEKITTRINVHVKERNDTLNCTVAKINEFGDTFRLEMADINKIILSVRHGLERLQNATNFLKIITARMIDILPGFPNLVCDIFTLCTVCLERGHDDCELLPAEACFLSSSQTVTLTEHTCHRCDTKYDFKTGFPVKT